MSFKADDRRKVAVGTAITVIGGLWIAGFKALGFVLRAVFGGPAYGLFAIVLSVTELLAYLLLGGFNDAIVYFASRHVHGEETPETERRLYSALATCLVPPLLIALALTGAIELALPRVYASIWAQHDPLIVDLMRVMALGLPLLVLVQLPAEATKAHLSFRWPVFIVQVLLPTTAAAAVLVLHLGYGMGIAALPAGLVAAAAICVPVSLYAYSRSFSIAKTLRAALALRWDGEVLRFAGPQSLNMMLNLGLVRLDSVILSWFVSANAVGVYSLVTDLTQLIRIAKMAFSSVFAPLVAKYQAMRNREGIRQALYSLVQITSALGFALLILAMTLYPHAILRAGESWTLSLWVPWLLAVGPMMSCCFGLSGNLLLMTGHARLLLFNSAVAGTINAVLNYVMIQRWGVLGAAAGTAIASFTISVLQVVEMGVFEKITFRVALYRRTALAALLPLALAAGAQTGAFVGAVAAAGVPLLAARVAVAVAAAALYAGILLSWPGENQLRDRLRALLRRGPQHGVATD
jgi:O-antigen/teichoic acid export membrane protein